MIPTLITPNLLWFISLWVADPACLPRGASFAISFDEKQLTSRPITRVPGVRGLAMRFDGIGDHIDLPSKKAYDVGEGDFTIELWMRTSKRQAASLIDKRSAKPVGYQLYLLRDTIGVQVSNGGHRANAEPSAYPVIDGKWHHIVAVAKRLPPQPPAMYIDGELRMQRGTSLPLENINTPDPLWIGRHHANEFVPRDAIFYTGDMDEFVIYQRALPAAEILERYRAFTQRRPSPCR